MLRRAFLVALALSAAYPLYSTPACIGGNDLASYIALGGTGCTIGPLRVFDFSFSVVSSGGGAVPIGDSNINLFPTSGTHYYGVLFIPHAFSVTGSQFVNYLIGYTWDPTGDIRGLGDVLDPGVSDILTNGCVGIAFSGAICAGTPVSVHVFQGVTTRFTDFVSFSPTNILGIRNNISLNANGASASITDFENDVYLPEPGSAFTCAAGLMLLAAAIFRRFTATNG